MPTKTHHIVQTFTQRGKKLVADQPIQCSTEEAALLRAEKVVPGVIAEFARRGARSG